MRFSAFHFLPYWWTLVSKKDDQILLDNSIGVFHQDYSLNLTQESIDPRIRSLLPKVIQENFFNAGVITSAGFFKTIQSWPHYYENEEYILIGGLNHIIYEISDFIHDDNPVRKFGI